MRAVRSAAVPLLALGLALSVTACTGKQDPAAAETSSGSPETSAPETSPPASPTHVQGNGTQISISLTGGQASGTVGGRISVSLGDPVTITVTSDTPDELHVHGYDLSAPVGPGTDGTLRFDATIPGVFEVELHDSEKLLLTLQVG